jgi:hypothetical protein
MDDTDFNYDDNSTILDIDTSDAQEPAAVDDGEYKLRITGQRKDSEGVIVRTSDKGNKFCIITLDIPDEPYSKGVSKLLMVPTNGMTAKQINDAKWEIECFKQAFNLPEMNFDAMIGKEGYGLLRKTFSEDYGEQNAVKKFITGA